MWGPPIKKIIVQIIMIFFCARGRGAAVGGGPYKKMGVIFLFIYLICARGSGGSCGGGV